MAETLGKKAAKKASGKKRGRPRKEAVQAKEGLVALVKKPCNLKGVLVVLARTLVTA